MDSLPKNSVVYGRSSRGVDRIAVSRAAERGLACKIFQAKWDKYGKSARYLSNEEIVLASDEIVVFWDGISPGTSELIDIAQHYGKPLKIIK